MVPRMNTPSQSHSTHAPAMAPDPDPKDETEFVDHIRAIAQTRMHATSLRAVARQVGMSPSGLSKFLAGARPYSKTLARLRAWYLWQSEQPATLSPEETLAALQLLTAPLPISRRPEAAAVVVAGIRNCFGGTPPRWWTEFERLADDTISRSAQPTRRKFRRRIEHQPVQDWADDEPL